MKIQLATQQSFMAYKTVDYYKQRSHISKIKNWISDICYRILDWLGDHITEEPYLAYRTAVIDTDTVADFVAKSVSEMMNHYHRKPAIVLLGEQEFRELTQNQSWIDFWSFPLDLIYGREMILFGMPVRNTTRMGLKVVVIPWMNGIVVLPSEEDLH